MGSLYGIGEVGRRCVGDVALNISIIHVGQSSIFTGVVMGVGGICR